MGVGCGTRLSSYRLGPNRNDDILRQQHGFCCLPLNQRLKLQYCFLWLAHADLSNVSIGCWDKAVDRQTLNGVDLSNSNPLSPKKKREQDYAWRQRQHHPKKDCLNRGHRRPPRVRLCESAARTLSVHRGHSLCQSERVDPGLLLPPGATPSLSHR